MQQGMHQNEEQGVDGLMAKHARHIQSNTIQPIYLRSSR